MADPLDIGEHHLTCADIADVAAGRTGVRLSETARSAIDAAHRRAVLASSLRPVYGRTTGVGAQRDVLLPDPVGQAQALVRSHATAAGRSRSERRVRATMLVRLNQLAAGGSGVDVAVADALAAMIEAGALPDLRDLGGIGTGDLPALAGLALALQGERATSAPVPRTVTFGPHDALPFISSNAATVADAALAAVDLERSARSAVVVAALTFCALGGNPEAFDPVVERVSPFDGARQVCRWMRALTAVPGEPAVPRRIQDPYGLRALPQVHGSLLDALAWLSTVVERMAGAPSENPVVLADGTGDEPAARVAHHGGFHTASLATALDSARSATVQAGQLVLTRVSSLCRPELTGLPAFLGDGTAGACGIMVLEYVAAAALADLRALASPVAVGTASLSLGAEDDAPFAATGARQAAEAVDALRVLLSCELVAAVRAIRAAGQPVSAPMLTRALDLCAELPDEPADRDLSPDLDVAGALLAELADLAELAGPAGS